MLAYDVGAVDYLTKPINPLVLRSKVNVFVDLFRKTRALAILNAKLEAQNEILEREAEERMRRIQAEAAQAEAEAANEAKDRFLAMLSHELRTPLTPILYAVSLLERDQTCPDHIREALTTIRRNVGVEVRLIDDLLDLARIRSGKLTLQIEAVDAHDILRDAIAICMGNVERRAARIVQEFRATNVRLEADPARVRQIFWNLLSNAVKFTPPEGTIHVRTQDFKDELQVEVTDTGPGIQPAKLNSVFDAFEQVLPESSAGLGLGLAICKALVELHGGSIEAQSLGTRVREHHSLSDFRLEVAANCSHRPAPPRLLDSELFGSLSWMITRIQTKVFVFCLPGRVMRFALPAASRRPSSLRKRSSLMS